MNTKLPLLALSLFVVAAAHAQLSYYSYTEDVSSYNSTHVGNYPSNVVQGFSSPDAYMYMETVDSWSLNRGETYWSGQHGYFFNLATGNLPSRINQYDLNLNGKFVFGGGGPSSEITATLSAGITLYQFDDLNGNNVYDNGETSYLAMSSGGYQIASLDSNGLMVYNTNIAASYPGSSYILGANSHYFALAQMYYSASGTFSEFDPQIVITNEFNYPNWSGAILHINHESVPEPATLTLLALPALAALKRRKR